MDTNNLRFNVNSPYHFYHNFSNIDRRDSGHQPYLKTLKSNILIHSDPLKTILEIINYDS